MTIKYKLITIFLVLALCATSCSKQNETPQTDINNSEINFNVDTATPAPADVLSPTQDDSSSATPNSTDNITSDSIDADLPNDGIPESDNNDDNEGLVGTVEYDETYTEAPLYLYDGLTYCILDDHAEVIYTFLGDDTLESYIVKSTIIHENKEYPVTVIGESAFYFFEYMTEVTIPDTVTILEANAFDSCASLTKVNLSNNLKSIGSGCFSECELLKEITIPDSVESIGESCFYNCSSLSKVVLSQSVSSLAPELFSGCEKLKEVVLPASLKSIGNEAFWYCESLETLVLPTELTVIESRAFYNMLSLKEINLPESLISITNDVFDYCDDLSEIQVPKDKLEYYTKLFEGMDEEIFKPY